MLRTLAGVEAERGRVPQDARDQQTQLIPRVRTDASATRVLPTAAPPRPPAPTTRRRRRWPWVLLVLLVGYPLLLGGLVLVGLDRVAAMPRGDRPAPTPGHSWLVVGSDSRQGLSAREQAELSTGGGTSRLTDTILMVTTAPDGTPTLISLPRDSYVEIPGYGFNKINAAFAFGGPRLLVRTVENATGVRLDGYVEVGFDGFYRIVQAAGGVEVCLPDPLQDERAGIDLPAGCQVLGGSDALGYVRARYSDPRGDLGRVERQQQFVGALADRATSPAVLLNPLRAVPLALATGQALTVDRSMGPLDLARFTWATRQAVGPDGQMLTVPVGGSGSTDVGSVLFWDDQDAPALWQALRDGTPVPRRLLD
jgi:LCP family protein required for cell wall assembly